MLILAEHGSDRAPGICGILGIKIGPLVRRFLMKDGYGFFSEDQNRIVAIQVGP